MEIQHTLRDIAQKLGQRLGLPPPSVAHAQLLTHLREGHLNAYVLTTKGTRVDLPTEFWKAVKDNGLDCLHRKPKEGSSGVFYVRVRQCEPVLLAVAEDYSLLDSSSKSQTSRSARLASFAKEVGKSLTPMISDSQWNSFLEIAEGQLTNYASTSRKRGRPESDWKSAFRVLALVFIKNHLALHRPPKSADLADQVFQRAQEEKLDLDIFPKTSTLKGELDKNNETLRTLRQRVDK